MVFGFAPRNFGREIPNLLDLDCWIFFAIFLGSSRVQLPAGQTPWTSTWEPAALFPRRPHSVVLQERRAGPPPAPPARPPPPCALHLTAQRLPVRRPREAAAARGAGLRRPVRRRAAAVLPPVRRHEPLRLPPRGAPTPPPPRPRPPPRLTGGPGPLPQRTATATRGRLDAMARAWRQQFGPGRSRR